MPICKIINSTTPEKLSDFADYEIDDSQLRWNISTIDYDSLNGSFSFLVPGEENIDSIFPIEIQFQSKMPYCGVMVIFLGLIFIDR